MDSIEEKRVYGERMGESQVYVAAAAGVARIHVTEDRVGEFGIVNRCSPRDIATGAGRVAVATTDDVLISTGTAFDPTGFDSAVAVGFGGGDFVAASPEGRLARFDGSDWRSLGDLDAVTAIDGDLVGTDRGVARLDDLTMVGLSDVRDVSAAGGPLAATATGLFTLGNGWMHVREGDFRMVAAPPADLSTLAHAATVERCFERQGGDWAAIDLPVDEPVVDAGYGDHPVLLTAEGTLLVDAGDGWRAHALGLQDAVGIVVPERKTV